MSERPFCACCQEDFPLAEKDARIQMGLLYPLSSRERSKMDGFADALKAQRSYVKSLKGKSVGLIVAPTFVRSIRQSGYLNTATALFELVDNSIEARAQTVHIVFGFSESSSAKPTSIAVIDDGHGMEPAMLRVALAWGGTHRENGRAGLGRFGYGLPTSCVSQGRKFSVYSQVSGHTLYRATLDLEAFAAQGNGSPQLPRPSRDVLPAWLEEYARKFRIALGHKGGHGTAVGSGCGSRWQKVLSAGATQVVRASRKSVRRQLADDTSLELHGDSAATRTVLRLNLLRSATGRPCLGGSPSTDPRPSGRPSRRWRRSTAIPTSETRIEWIDR